ncbi:MAG: alpha/beta hydrolase-fold protein [Sumerlaeia bacterium]
MITYRPHFLSLLCAFVLAANWVAAQTQTPEHLIINHYSPALQREQTFEVYLPASATDEKPMPVLYVLHGAWGSNRDWPSQTDIIERAADYRLILVFPDGGEFGWYLDSPIEKDSQYESYMIGELIPLIDRMFPTTGTREGRGIMGLSMGGHGAMTLAAKHPDTFASASSLSGILNITNHPDKWHMLGRLGSYEENTESWEDNSAWHLAPAFQDTDIALLFDSGTSDTAAIGDNRQFHDRLTDLGVPHIWREFPGGHTWDYWREHLPQHLNFHQANLLAADANAPKWFNHYYARMNRFVDENAQWELDADIASSPTVVLLGSSSAEGFPEEFLTDYGYRVFDRGISADRLGITSRGVSHRLNASAFDIAPDFLFIKNGRNDLGVRAQGGEPSIARMIEEYDEILTALRANLPDTKIHVVTCAPVSGRYAHLADATRAYNEELKNLAKEKGFPVVDVWKALVGEDGLLPEDLTTDGLHMNRDGYAVWGEMMREAMTE